MRKLLIQTLIAAVAVCGLAACTPGTGTGDPPAGSTSAAPSSTAPSATSPSGTTSGSTPAPDSESTVPAPSPSAPPAPSAGPGAGNAELAITVKPSEADPAVNYTLVCKDGIPAAESQHPNAAAACTALKNNAALLSPAPRGKNVACTDQYGGPQQATVTGIVDETPVNASLSRTDGCEIGAWDAAKDVLGAAGGAV